jgi:hypothetical protein
MATTHDINLQTAASYVKNLTTTVLNAEAAPEATPRLGGFVLRNRLDAAVISVADRRLIPLSCVYSTTKIRANQLQVLSVPKRTLVKSVNVFSVAGETKPGFKYTHTTADKSTTDSDFVATTLNFTAVAYKSADQSSLATPDDGVFGAMSLDALASSTSVITSGISGSLLATLASSSISTPTQAYYPVVAATTLSSSVADAGTYGGKAYFPFGGFVVMNQDGSSAAHASSDSRMNLETSHLNGVWEIQAECEYVPE